MSTPFNAAAAAYGVASQLITQSAKLPDASSVGGQDFARILAESLQSLSGAGKAGLENSGGQGTDFASLLADSVQSVVDTGKASDRQALDMVDGKANVVDVVTAISQTEIAIESMVTVRDRVISAYVEIMRMPI
jgi:flagellar hook-basal body complex protein FliE